jgi:predicted ATPase
MIHTIKFKNYKSFKEEQTLVIKPITILIGINSAGKSAITKLPTLLSNSLQGNFNEPLKLNNGGVELGAEFRDLVYGRTRLGKLEFSLEDNNEKLDIVIGAGPRSADNPEIFSWTLKSKEKTEELEYADEKSFRGFHVSLGRADSAIKSLSINTDYIGPFRVLPERQYSDLKKVSGKHIGIKGENTYPIIIRDALSLEKKLLNQVSEWYEKSFEGWGLQVNADTEPFYQLELTRGNGDVNINFRDVGQGMSQLLPIVTRAFMPTAEETLIVVEQPELHLHPSAHGDVAELLVDTLKSGGKKYLIETHSQNFILRIRALVASKKINHQDISLYYVKFNSDTDSSSLEKITIDQNGNVDHWPKGIFDEALLETIAIRTAQQESQVK